MRPLAVHHVSINVDDVETAIAFYCGTSVGNLIGCTKRARDPAQRADDRRTGRLGARRASRRVKLLLDTDEAIRFLDQAGDVRWSDPLAAERCEVLVSRPTGDGASLSDVHRHLVLSDLGQQFAHRRDPETLESLADIHLHQLRRVAGQHYTDRVTNLE